MYGLEPDDGLVEQGPSGKPHLVNYPKIHFNISHSGGYAVCAIGPEPVGVDIEFWRALDYGRLAGKAFAEEEKKELESSCDPQRFFFDRWVEKESYLKWKGTGITRDMKEIDCLDGWNCHFELSEGCSCAIWSEKPMKLKICNIDYYELFEDDRMQ
nr:4'-phosphopantetheinyl transferase superfamily protein [Ruminococcus sp. OA3]